MNLTKEEVSSFLNLLTSNERVNVELSLMMLKDIEFKKALYSSINLANWLIHNNGNVVKLGLSFVEEYQVVSSFITEIFAVYKLTSNNKIRRKAKKILENNALPQLEKKINSKWLLKKANNNTTHPSGQTIRKNIIRYAENCEIDGTKLAVILYEKYKLGLNYLINDARIEERRKYLNKNIKGTTLTLVGSGLVTFPTIAYEFLELTEIDLSNNKISVIPDEIQLFQNLKTLKLSKNKLSDLNPKLLTLTGLTELSINKNLFKEYPSDLCKLTQLKKINIAELFEYRNYSSYSAKIEIPKHFQKETGLEELRMASATEGISIYARRNEYPHVTIVSGKNINLDPLALAQMAHEQNKNGEGLAYVFRYGTKEMKHRMLSDYYDKTTGRLELNNTCIENIPKEILNFEIRHLNLKKSFNHFLYDNNTCNKIEPESELEKLGELIEIETLNLGFNGLERLPDSLKKLKKLTFLDLDYNSFTGFPMVICHLESLVELNFRHAVNEYGFLYRKELEIPETISQLKNLKVLNFSLNGLEDNNRMLKYQELFDRLLPDCTVNFD